MSKQLFAHLPGARPPVASLSLLSGSAARPPHVASLRQDGQRASQNVSPTLQIFLRLQSGWHSVTSAVRFAPVQIRRARP